MPIMIRRILRAIDLGFTVNDRARRAVMAARVAGMPVSVMDDGSLEVKANICYLTFGKAYQRAGRWKYGTFSSLGNAANPTI